MHFDLHQPTLYPSLVASRVLQRSLWLAFVALLVLQLLDQHSLWLAFVVELQVRQLDIWRLLELGAWPKPHDCYLLLQLVLKAWLVLTSAIHDSDSSVFVDSIEVVHHMAVVVAFILHCSLGYPLQISLGVHCSLDFLPLQLPFRVNLHF